MLWHHERKRNKVYECIYLSYLTLRHTSSDGADPFVANLSSISPYDVAVLAGDVCLRKRLERKALFAGEVEIMVGQGKAGGVMLVARRGEGEIVACLGNTR